MKMSLQLKTTLLCGVVALALVLPALAGEKNKEKLKLADCPTAVQQTIKDNAGGGEIKEVEKATKKDGTVIYEADAKKADGKKIEVQVAADGKLIKVSSGEEEDDDEKEGEKDDTKK